VEVNLGGKYIITTAGLSYSEQINLWRKRWLRLNNLGRFAHALILATNNFMLGVSTMDKKRAIINPAKCDRRPGCPAHRICPANAIEKTDDNGWYVGADCTGCGKCIRVCPMKAILLV